MSIDHLGSLLVNLHNCSRLDMVLADMLMLVLLIHSHFDMQRFHKCFDC